mmetsp:Transcript_22567/g.90432  ORF Transcript_22567/g.90432 Transcript_22567/m.90432 type:complete len:174 (+) Transcript_22567:1367-1888(+)
MFQALDLAYLVVYQVDLLQRWKFCEPELTQILNLVEGQVELLEVVLIFERCFSDVLDLVHEQVQVNQLTEILQVFQLFYGILTKDERLNRTRVFLLRSPTCNGLGPKHPEQRAKAYLELCTVRQVLNFLYLVICQVQLLRFYSDSTPRVSLMLDSLSTSITPILLRSPQYHRE